MNQKNNLIVTEKLRKSIYDACKTGDLEAIQNFLTSDLVNSDHYKSFDYRLLTPTQLYEDISSDTMATIAISNNQFEITKTIFNSTYKNDELFAEAHIDNYFRAACEQKNLEIFKFLLNHPKIIKTKEDNIIGLISRVVTTTNNLNMLQYLFDNFPTHKESQLYKNVAEGDIIIHAARNGYLDIIKYVVFKDEVKDSIDLTLYNNEAFKAAYTNGHLETVQYLIFDLNLQMTQSIKEHIENDAHASKEVFKMFETQALNHSLRNELDNNTKKSIKVKL